MESKLDINCPNCNNPILAGAVKDILIGKYIGYTVCRNCMKEFTETRYHSKATEAKNKAVKILSDVRLDKVRFGVME